MTETTADANTNANSNAPHVTAHKHGGLGQLAATAKSKKGTGVFSEEQKRPPSPCCASKWNIPKNLMFIGSPGDHLVYGLSELGGVRLVI